MVHYSNYLDLRMKKKQMPPKACKYSPSFHIEKVETYVKQYNIELSADSSLKSIYFATKINPYFSIDCHLGGCCHTRL